VLDREDFGYIAKASDLRNVLDKPADPKTWRAINEVALNNLEKYTKAFYFTPRNDGGENKFSQPVEAPDEARTPKQRDEDPVKGKRGSSIWPAWWYENIFDHTKGKARYWHPFDEAFWADDEKRKEWAREEGEDPRKVEIRERPLSTEPDRIEGFIVAMPWLWTAGENNNSGLNVKIIAQLEEMMKKKSGTAMAAAGKTDPSPSERT
jgi:phospholipase D1/2